MILHLAVLVQTCPGSYSPNARACKSNVGVEGFVIDQRLPTTFIKPRSILVQVHILGAESGSHSTVGREGDSIVAWCHAGEDARVQVQYTISSPRSRSVVVVGQEGFVSF